MWFTPFTALFCQVARNPHLSNTTQCPAGGPSLWVRFYGLLSVTSSHLYWILNTIFKKLVSCFSPVWNKKKCSWDLSDGCVHCTNTETPDHNKSPPPYPLLNTQMLPKDPLGGRRRRYWNTSPWLVHFLLEWASKADPLISAHPLLLLSSSQLSHAITFSKYCCSPYQDIFNPVKQQCMSEYFHISLSRVSEECGELLKFKEWIGKTIMRSAWQMLQ